MNQKTIKENKKLIKYKMIIFKKIKENWKKKNMRNY